MGNGKPVSARALNKKLNHLVRQRGGWRAQLTKLERANADKAELAACRAHIDEVETKMNQLMQLVRT